MSRATWFASQVLHADEGWLTYDGIFDVDNLSSAAERAAIAGMPAGPRQYVGYRVIDLRTRETIDVENAGE